MQQKNSFGIKLLSVIVPAFKQERTIATDVKNIEKALHALDVNYEILVVVDGMIDGTYEQAKKLRSSKVKVLGYKDNQGKGHAVRYGMLEAKGDIIGFIDAGMDIDTIGFAMLLNHMQWYNADIIVGSKLHPASKVNYPLYRKVLSWGYRLFTRLLFGFKVRDTQVGLKMFKRKVIKDVLPRLLVKNYAFDIEILAVSYALGYRRIFEAPVEINFQPNSTIKSTHLWRTISLMLWDTLSVYYRLHIVKYYTKNQKNNYQHDARIKSENSTERLSLENRA